MNLPLVWTAHQVAAALGLGSARQFHARRARLEAAGFPPPLAALPDRWSIVAVEAWVGQSKTGERVDRAEFELLRRALAMGTGPTVFLP